MDIRQITPDFFAAPQIAPEDMPEIAAAGIRLVLCNRPDSEIPPHLQASVLEKAAAEAGLAFAYVPLTHQSMTPDVIARNAACMQDSDGPVLAYCASGTRSTIAWALAAAKEMPADDVVAAALKGGYDLRSMKPALDAAAQA